MENHLEKGNSELSIATFNRQRVDVPRLSNVSQQKRRGVHRLALDLKHRIGRRHSVTVHSEIRTSDEITHECPKRRVHVAFESCIRWFLRRSFGLGL
jgi:hypothetical protein